MKRIFHHKIHSRALLRLCLPGLCLAFLAILLSASALRVRADAGGFPTATHTPRPTRTPTTQPTEGFLLFPVTPTFTVLPIFSNPNPGNPILGLQAATPTPAPRSGFTLFSCWPFAIVALAILAAGVLWLRSRVAQPAP